MVVVVVVVAVVVEVRHDPHVFPQPFSLKEHCHNGDTMTALPRSPPHPIEAALMSQQGRSYAPEISTCLL
ncbi:hypothetical protein E2C01_070108 [Portunus trituberculatus]|uniref:Uncharacterized protein n=1 Tax=Portunus trituberculatus TaxID=210409 RepID=A0A5B7I0P7_PORTR|nr:hypothetical protein [Portunus trituberculatus]